MEYNTNPYSIGLPVAWRVKDFADGWVLFDDETRAYHDSKSTGAILEALYSDTQVDKLKRQLTHAHQMETTRLYVSFEKMRGACERWKTAAWIWFGLLVILMACNIIGALI